MKALPSSMKTLSAIILVTAVCLPSGASAERGKGYHMQKGMHHGMSGRFGSKYKFCWKRTLTDKQRSELRQIKLSYKRQKYLLKAQLRQARVQLALHATSNKPSQRAIDKKIGEITRIKGKMIKLKVNKLVRVRRILTPEQRLSFDMKVLKKAYKGKRCRHHRRRHH